MSKIICDICGTVYPDNATVCPICGYPRQDSEKAIMDEAEMKASESRHTGTYVKGGRFSSKNVKRRQKGENISQSQRSKKSEPARRADPAQRAESVRKAPQSGKTAPSARPDYVDEAPVPTEDARVVPTRAKAGPGLKITVSVLAVAVIAVSGYIAYRFIDGASAYDRPSVGGPTEPQVQTQASETETSIPVETGIPCVGLSVSDEKIVFEGVGRAWMLAVTTVPENATQSIQYTSSNEKVATVNEQGRVTSVGPGQAVITITCGDIVRECKVLCNFEGADVTEETDAQSGKPTTPTKETESNKHYKDNNWTLSNAYGDATLIIGEEFTLELNNDAGETADVQWKADRDGVVSIKGNVIRGEYEGTVDVSATINGKTYTCIVRVIPNR